MQTYRTYVLRIWNENQNSDSRRLTLENTRTGSRVGFTEWETLIAYLEEQKGLAQKERDSSNESISSGE